MDLSDKYKNLKQYISKLENLAVAYSGGVDSTFLLKVAYDVLDDNVIAITAISPTHPKREYSSAVSIVNDIGVCHYTVETFEMEDINFTSNPSKRCYYCKKEIFTRIKEEALKHGIDHVADGLNFDDTGDYRPGIIAAKELGIISPLKEMGITKQDIRILSKQIGLPTWNKPAFACLATRFPYGYRITEQGLKMVDRAEQFLYDRGFRQFRVRVHGDIARIEVSPTERSKFFDEKFMDLVANEFKKIGFIYTALDLQGYRTGSMNEVL